MWVWQPRAVPEPLLIALVALEGAGLIVLTVLWRRSASQAAALRRELHGDRGRRWIPSGKDAVKAVMETAALVRERGVGGALRSSIEDLAGWAEVERPDLARLAAADGTVTILFTDIEGSTALNEELGDRKWVGLLARHDKVIRGKVDAHGGHVVKNQGDGFMVAFAGADEAVDCAVDIQRAMSGNGSRRADPRISVRIGIHKGDAVHRDGDLFGRNVSYAARVAEHALGGEILISQAVLEGGSPGIRSTVDETRDVELKGVPGRHRLHLVGWADGSPA